MKPVNDMTDKDGLRLIAAGLAFHALLTERGESYICAPHAAATHAFDLADAFLAEAEKRIK